MGFRIIYYLILLSLYNFSCKPSSEKKIVTKEVIEELESRRIKKVTPSQLNSIAYDRGRKLKDVFLDSLRRNSSVMTCDSVAASLSRDDQNIKLINLDTTLGAITKTEKVLIESYLYSFENNLPFGDNISENETDTLIYTDVLTNNESFACDQLDSIFLFITYLPTKSIIRSLDN